MMLCVIDVAYLPSTHRSPFHQIRRDSPLSGRIAITSITILLIEPHSIELEMKVIRRFAKITEKAPTRLGPSPG